MKLLLCLLAHCCLLAAPTQARTQKGSPQRGTLAPQGVSAPPAVQVFPNPAHGDFTVRLPDAAPPAGVQLELVNVLGRVVFQQALPAAAQVTVPAGTMPAGLYWVRLRGPQGYQATQRVVLS